MISRFALFLMFFMTLSGCKGTFLPDSSRNQEDEKPASEEKLEDQAWGDTQAPINFNINVRSSDPPPEQEKVNDEAEAADALSEEGHDEEDLSAEEEIVLVF